MNGNPSVRRELHSCVFRVHQLLDELEADCTLNEPDYL